MSSIRLDVFLDVSCLFKTRSEAQKAIKGGKVDVNGENAQPQKGVKIGDKRLVDPWLGCGQCKVCLRGDEQLCLNPASVGIIRNGDPIIIETLAGRLGYASQSHFTRVFSALTGMTPARYRRGLADGRDASDTHRMRVPTDGMALERE